MSQYHQLTAEQPESVKKLNLPGNTSVVLLKKQTIEVRDEALPILQPDGVLVKVISTDESFLALRRSLY
jgi:D-xylulose reductase